MLTPSCRHFAVAGAALLLVSGCSAPATVTPASTPATSSTPAASASSASAIPTASATPTATMAPVPTITVTAQFPKRKPSLAQLTCTPSVSEESGDPIILISYRVTDPDRAGWNLTISYSNEEGRHTEKRTGTGSKSETFKAYGSFDPTFKPNCNSTISAR